MTRRAVAAAHSAFLLGGGVWPLAHMRSFLAVTGPKHELWLVRTIAWVMLLLAGVLGSAAARDRVDGELTGLGAGSTAVFGGVDVWYALKGRISPVYLVDAVAQALLLRAWLRARR